MIGYLLAGVVLAALIGWVITPLLVGRVSKDARGGEAESVARLIEEKLAIYRSLLDLDHDHRIGKVADEDYAILRHQQETAAAHILRKLDRYVPEDNMSDLLEREIADARRQLQTRGKSGKSST